MNINKNYQNLEQSYLFSTVAKKVKEFSEKNPDKKWRMDNFIKIIYSQNQDSFYYNNFWE